MTRGSTLIYRSKPLSLPDALSQLSPTGAPSLRPLLSDGSELLLFPFIAIFHCPYHTIFTGALSSSYCLILHIMI